MATRVLTTCAGFLLAVLWFDLMFDVQVLGRAMDPLPAHVLESISRYYRRVTTEAAPMGNLVGLVMLIGAGAALVQAWRADLAGWRRVLPIVLLVAPVALALGRVVPHAIRLGAAADPPALQSQLARGICFDHLLCFVSIAALLVVQLTHPLAARHAP